MLVVVRRQQSLGPLLAVLALTCVAALRTCRVLPGVKLYAVRAAFDAAQGRRLILSMY